MKVVALAGGVGGAKLADGLAQVLCPEDFSIIVNTGDDFKHLGMKVCPDLDTICYTLAGLANPVTGWGRDNETWNAMESITSVGGPNWFNLGDQDLGTHLERTRRLKAGHSLSQITRDFCNYWQIGPRIFPMSDDPVPTVVLSDQGDLPFQEYFVKKRCKPKVTGFHFADAEISKPAPGVISSLQEATLVILCPSNPWVSIDPILAVPGIRKTLIQRTPAGKQITLAVSPIIAGKAVKGPVVKMYQELGFTPSAYSVAEHYGGLLHGFILDKLDVNLVSNVQQLQMKVLMTNTLMKTRLDRSKLAEEVIEFGKRLLDNHY